MTNQFMNTVENLSCYSKHLQILKYQALQEYFKIIFKPNLQFYKMFGLINL